MGVKGHAFHFRVLIPIGDWAGRRDLPCRREDPELFQPISPADPRIAAARAVCGRCPVADACLQHGVDHPGEEGIWGGATAEERRYFAKNPQVFAAWRAAAPLAA